MSDRMHDFRPTGRSLSARVAALLLVVAGTSHGGVNQWTTNGPGHTVSTVLVDSSRAGGVWLYAGTTDGVYRSIDDGLSWTAVPDSLSGHNVLSLAIVPGETSRLLAGTDLGLLVSDDAGASWQRADGPGSGIMALATRATAQGSVIYAGSLGRGVFVSDDGGLSWTSSPDLRDAIVFALRPAALDGETIYAGTTRGLFVSRDGGQTWSVLGNQLQGMSVRGLATASSDPNLLVAATFANGVFRSSDGGSTWTQIGADLESVRIRALTAEAGDVDVMYVATSTDGFYRTRDGGVSWQPINQGLDQLTSRSVAVRSPGRLLGAGTGTGVWQIRFAPEPGIQVSPAAVDFGPVPMATTLTRDLLIHNDGSADLVVSNIQLDGSSGFGHGFSDPFAVGPGADAVVEVSFAPAILDFTVRDTLRVSSNDPSGADLAVPLMGRGARSMLRVQPSRLDFGAVRIPPGHAEDTIRVFNDGSVELSVLDASSTNNRFTVHGFEPISLRPNEWVDLRIAFDSLLPGAQQRGTIVILSDSTPDRIEVPVSGTPTAPDIVLSETVLDFGRVDIGDALTLPLVVTNSGSADLTISRLVSPAGGQFTIDRTLGVPRDTSFVVSATDTIVIVADDDTTVALNETATLVEVGRDTTRLIADGDTTIVVTDTDTTRILVGTEHTVFTATEETTVLSPGTTFTFQVTYRPTVSGPVRDTLEVVNDAPLRFGSLSVVLRGEGNALSLEPGEPVPVGTAPVAMVVASLDGQTGPDLAVVDSVAGRLHVLHNDGLGGYPEANRTSYPTPLSAYGAWVEPVAVAAAPIFASGSNDLIVGDRVARSISLVANDGDGGFESRREDIFIGHQLSDLVAVDLDTDGDVDVAVANGPDAETVTLLYNDGLGVMSARAVVPVQAGPVSLAAGNLNADGHVDLVVANRLSNTVTVLLNDRDGAFVISAHHTAGVDPVDLSLADADADGDIDIAVAATTSRTVNLLLNNGDGEFTEGQTPEGTTLRPFAVAADGMTADKLKDYVVGGTGDFLVFYENIDGVDYERQKITTESPVHDVHLVDVDGNQVSDVLTLSRSAAQIQVFRNRLVGRQVPPRAPASVTAADVQGDLGGRVVIAWEDGDYGRQQPEDQVIATTEYVVVRGSASDFDVADTLGTVPGGVLSFTDDSATPYETFFYQVTARREGLASAPSAPVSARSLPAPLLDLRLSNAPRLSLGDTLRAQVYLTPAQHQVAGLSVFLSYDPDSLQLLPLPADSNKVFRVSDEILAGFTPVMNARHDSVATTGKLDLSLISSAPDVSSALVAGVEPVLLAEIWFRARQQTTTFLAFDDEPLLNRHTAIVEDGTGALLQPVLGDTTRFTVQDAYVSGQVSLQGRDSSAVAQDRATLMFLDSAGDTLASAVNDIDRLTPGIQVDLDRSGGFVLRQIPPGTYNVYAKVATHLQGIVVGDTATADSNRRNMTFHWIAPDSTTRALLPAGDANDDNRINLADFGLLVRHYGATPAVTTWGQAQAANFDGDNRVGLDDFMLLADNFGRLGVNAVPKTASSTKAVPRPGHVRVSDDGDLIARGLGPVRGLTLRLPAGTVASAEATLFEGRHYEMFEWSHDGRRRVALALRDHRPVDGDGVLLRLGSVTDRVALLASVEVLDAAGQVYRPVAGIAGPVTTTLHANYPNPFNPATTIPFDIAGSGPVWVRLEIYDLLGQVIRILVDEAAVAPGSYTVEWDGRDGAGRSVASGPYFTRFTAPGTLRTQRLLLLR